MKERNEQKFVELVKKEMQNRHPGYEFAVGAPLQYRIYFDPNGDLTPATYRTPRRGNGAFETDLLIKKKGGVPLVAVEVKYGGFSTHDILTYSSKAVKHKELWPHLRYGLLVGNVTQIEKRFFTHNVGMDFVLGIKAAEDKELAPFLLRQIEQAERKIALIQCRHVKAFELSISFEE